MSDLRSYKQGVKAGKSSTRGEIEQLREAAALAYQALLWRGVLGYGDSEEQAQVALEALRDLGLAPLYFRRLEESPT